MSDEPQPILDPKTLNLWIPRTTEARSLRCWCCGFTLQQHTVHYWMQLPERRMHARCLRFHLVTGLRCLPPASFER